MSHHRSDDDGKDAVAEDPSNAVLIGRLLGAAVHFRALRLKLLLDAKANFDPNQPRVPRGYRNGGRWVKPGQNLGPRSEGEEISGDPEYVSTDRDGRPEIPKKRPMTLRGRRSIVGAVLRYLLHSRLAHNQLRDLVREVEWFAEEYGRAVEPYFDEPRSLEELQARAPRSRPGYDIHHVVEQTAARQDGFPEELIEASENRVSVPRFAHRRINAWYQRKNPDFGYQSPREYLRGKSWLERREVGLRVLHEFGVLK